MRASLAILFQLEWVAHNLSAVHAIRLLSKQLLASLDVQPPETVHQIAGFQVPLIDQR